MLAQHRLYAVYMLRHKLYVYQAGRRLGLPRWQLWAHDWQKFTPAEWGPYMRRFHGLRDPEDFNPAWLHHQRAGGKHHWEYWLVLRPDGTLCPVRMPDRYRREMLADWCGAAKAQGNPDVPGWYLKHRGRLLLHPDTAAWLAGQLGLEHGA